VDELESAASGGIPLAILTCSGCGRGGLRVPDGRRGKVTCPRCGAEWFHPETIELSEVEFRCAKSGARFVVQSSRRSPLHKFAIQVIKKAPPRPSKPIDQVCHGAKGDLVQPFNASTNRLPGPKPAGLLARLFGRSTAIAPAAEPSLLAQEGESQIPLFGTEVCPWASIAAIRSAPVTPVRLTKRGVN
jgi:hypothetical protein